MRVPKFGATPATSAGFRAAQSAGVPTPPGLAQGQQIGEALSAFGQGASALGEQMQVEVDEAEVQSAANLYDEYTRGVLDPMKGFPSKLGRDAKDGYEDAVKELEEKRKEFGQRLQNPRQRELYEQYSKQRRDRSRSFLDSHAAKQVRAYNIGEKKAAVDSHAEDYIGLMTLPTPADPAEAARVMQQRRYALAELRQVTGDYADLQGQGPQERAQTVRQAERAAHAQVVQGLIEAGRYDEAEAMLRTGDDDAGIDYYMDDAIAAGIEPEDGHWASRIPNGPNRGMILKKPHHPTFHKTLKGEKAAGMKWFYRPDNGRYYTFPAGDNPGEGYVEQEPSAEEMRSSLTTLEREKYRAQIKRGRAIDAKLLEAGRAQQLEAQRASDLRDMVEATSQVDDQAQIDQFMGGDPNAFAMPTPSQRGRVIRQKALEYARKNNMSADEESAWLAQADNAVRVMTNRHVLDSTAVFEQAMDALRQNPNLTLQQLPNIAAIELYGQTANVQKAISEQRAAQMEPVLERLEQQRSIWRSSVLIRLAEGDELEITPGLRQQAAAFGMDLSAFPDGYVLDWDKPNATAEEEEVMRRSIISLGAVGTEYEKYFGKLRRMRGGVAKTETEAAQEGLDEFLDQVIYSAGVDVPRGSLPRNPTSTQMANLIKQQRLYGEAKNMLMNRGFLARLGLTRDSSLLDFQLAAPQIREKLTLSLPDTAIGNLDERQEAREKMMEDTSLELMRDDVVLATPENLTSKFGITPKMQAAIVDARKNMMVPGPDGTMQKANLPTDSDDILKTVEALREGRGDPELRDYLSKTLRGERLVEAFGGVRQTGEFKIQ